MKNLILFTFLLFAFSVIGQKLQIKPSYIESSNPLTNELYRTFYYYDNNQNVIRIDKFKDLDVILKDSVKQNIRLLIYKELFEYDKHNRLIKRDAFKVENSVQIINNIPIIFSKTKIILEENFEY